MLKQFFKFFMLALAVLLGPFMVWELWLQFQMRFINDDPYEIIMYRDVHHRINHYWNEGYENKLIFWGPPYNVFLNRGEDDSSRRHLIHQKSIMPTDKNGLTANFLRPQSKPEDSYYQVTINSLGFRNAEYKVKKDKNTFRIFVLGSYPAFGSGVNDHETYSAQLEEKLQKLKPEMKVEIWNGGQQGTTAISGYARLVEEIMTYEPDLLIWDFGWVDLYFGKDFVEQEDKAQYHYPFTQELMRMLWRHFPRLLFSRHLYHLVNSGFRDELLEDWRRINIKMIQFADQHELPVLLLKQRVVIIPDAEYQSLAELSPRVKFVNFQKIFRSDDTALTTEQFNEFWSRPNWLTEGGFEKEDPIRPERMFRVDAIMYNKFAHALIADKLTEHVLPLMDRDAQK